MIDIKSNTSLVNFPEIYNANNSEILLTIDRKYNELDNRLKYLANENKMLRLANGELQAKIEELQNEIKSSEKTKGES